MMERHGLWQRSVNTSQAHLAMREGEDNVLYLDSYRGLSHNVVGLTLSVCDDTQDEMVPMIEREASRWTWPTCERGREGTTQQRVMHALQRHHCYVQAQGQANATSLHVLPHLKMLFLFNCISVVQTLKLLLALFVSANSLEQVMLCPTSISGAHTRAPPQRFRGEDICVPLS